MTGCEDRSQPGIRIVPGKAAGLTVIGDLYERAFNAPRGRAAVADLTRSPAAWSLVAMERGGAVGFVIGMTAAGEAEIHSLGVPGEHRGRGIAKALLRKAGELVLGAGTGALFLEVAEDNAEAVGLYRRMGFLPVGRRRGYYRRGPDWSDALILRKKLRIPADQT